MSGEKKLAVSLRISRCYGGERGDGVRIEIKDSESHVQFLSLELSIEQFGRAVASMLVDDLECTVRGAHLIGMKHEVKRELVLFDRYREGGKPDSPPNLAELAALGPFEVDGWRGSYADLRNGHRTKREGDKRFQEVVFRRHVDPATGQPVDRSPR